MPPFFLLSHIFKEVTMLLDKIRRFFFSPVLKILSISKLPEYKTSGSACFDLSITRGRALQPNELHNFSTGFKMEIPKGWCLLIFARSSLGQKKCIIPNSVGVIDSDYRGEVMIPVLNLSTVTVLFEEDQRIAQGLLVRADQCSVVRAFSLAPSLRGDGGFGSTGI